MSRTTRSNRPLWLALALACAGACAHDELGTGVRVNSIAIEGNDALSEGDILEGLATEETGWWPFAGTKWFDQAAFDQDLKRIPAFYADHGFFDARVVDSKVHRFKKRGKDVVDIVVRVQENPPTNIRAVGLAGFPADQEQPARKRAAALDVEAGQRFDYGDYAALRGALEARLHEQSYAYGKVDGKVEVDRDAHTATVGLEARPGPRVRFGKTTVEGSSGIDPALILRRVTWREGEWFDERDLVATQRRLFDTGAFGTVKVAIPDAPSESADVRVTVRPGRLHEVRVGGGVGAERLRQEARLRLEYTKSSFLGGLRKLRVRVRPAFVVVPGITDPVQYGPAIETEAALTQPDFLRSNLSLRALGGYDVGIAQGYQYRGPRAQLGVDRTFARDRLLLGAAWNFQYLDFYDVDPQVFNEGTNRFFGFEDPYRLAYIEAFTQLDLRDRPLDPREGAFFGLRFEEGDPSLGGAFRYFKVTPEVRGYVPLGRRVVGALRGLGGWLGPYGGQESPITRRFALGGPSTHRGFGFARLAPQAVGTDGRLVPVGGNAQVLFSGELRIDVTKLGGTWLGVTPFVDAGDVTPSFADLDLGRLNVAVGADVTYDTPVGVARAGLGVRVNRLGPGNPDPDDRIAFHITIGEAF